MNVSSDASKLSFLFWSSLALSSLLLVAVSLFIGPSNMAGATELAGCLTPQLFPSNGNIDCETVQQIIFDIRLPRVLLAFLVGAALSVSGTSFQALLRNPLVSPDILGLSSGASFGAALAIIFPLLPLQLSAFFFGTIAVLLSYALARTRSGVSAVALILSGVVVSGIFTALLTIAQFSSDPYKLQTIVHWTMGNLHTADWIKVRSALPLVLVGSLALFLLRWRMNVISLGDEETAAIGLNPEWEKILVLVPASLTASAVVAVAGVIPLIGLVIPHIVRLLLGPDNRRCVPASIGIGGIFMLLVDDLTRSWAAYELPIGVITTLVAAPVFVFLLKTRRLYFAGN